MVMYTTSVPQLLLRSKCVGSKTYSPKVWSRFFQIRPGRTLTTFSIEIPVCLTVQAYVGPSGLVQG